MVLELDSLLLELLVFVVGASVFRWIAAKLHQPTVVGELVLGILLGASALGRLWPQGHAVLFPAENRVFLEALSWIGLVIFMYLAGAELRWTSHEAKPTIAVALGGLFIPFLIGSLLAITRDDWFFRGPASFSGVVLVAIAFTVSALPVLARILEDLHMMRFSVATIAMGAATIDDATAWIVLALVGGAAVGLTGILGINLAVIVGVFLLALFADRTLRPWFRDHDEIPKTRVFTWLIVAIFGSAFLTHAAGLHAVLGPFAVGAVVGRHAAVRAYAETRLGDLTRILLLPAFFILAGADIDLSLVSDRVGILTVLLVAALATMAKVSGILAGGIAIKLPLRDSIGLGFLLNARGAVGLVVARVGLDEGLLSTRGFTLIVLMVTLTTLAAPILFRVTRTPAELRKAAAS